MKLKNGSDIAAWLRARTAFEKGLGESQAPGASDVVRDGAIQRFEFTLELSWKTLRRCLRLKGSQVNHPKDVIREAAAEGWLAQPAMWLTVIDLRNETSHVYDEPTAQRIYDALPEFQTELATLVQVIQKL